MSSLKSFIEHKHPYQNKIGHDESNALQLLKDKLKALQDTQEEFKAVNKIVKSKLSSPYKVKKIMELTGCSEGTAISALTPDFMGRVGIPAYAMTNNNGNMKAVRDRITALERKSSLETTSEEVNGITVSTDTNLNRITVHFPERPSKDICEFLKGHGFRWSPTTGLWLAYISEWNLKNAKKVWEMVAPQAPRENQADIMHELMMCDTH